MKWIDSISPISFPSLRIDINPPEGISFGVFSIQFYGVIIAVGLLLACLYGLRRRKQFGLTQDDILDGALMIIPFAIICARLYYVVFSWEDYKNNLVRILYIWEGGLAIYGAVIGAGIGILVYCWRKKLPITTALDITSVSFLIGQSIGRWGNFFNREAFGAKTGSFLRMGLYLTEDQMKGAQEYFYHPTFLYESVWNAIGFVILHFASKRRKYDGQVALGYVAWYGLGRTFIEGLRTDSLYIFKAQLGETLRVSQLLAAVSSLAAVTVLVIMAFREHDPAKLYVNRVAVKEAEKAAEAEAEIEWVLETEEETEEDTPESDDPDTLSEESAAEDEPTEE